MVYATSLKSPVVPMPCNYDADATTMTAAVPNSTSAACATVTTVSQKARAIAKDGSEAGYDCDGVCLNDADGDGVCDEFEIAGCQDDSACNYNADATDSDDSCEVC